MRLDKRRARRLAGLGLGATLAVLPPPGDEIIALELGGIIGGYKMSDDTVSTSGSRLRRRGGEMGPNDATPKWVAYIVIGAIVVLAAEAGLLRRIVVS